MDLKKIIFHILNQSLFFSRASKRNSTYCLGEKDWLNGFDGENDQGLVFATSLRDNTILLVKWRTLTHHKKEPSDEQEPSDLYDLSSHRDSISSNEQELQDEHDLAEESD